jgi:hypothetical protein
MSMLISATQQYLEDAVLYEDKMCCRVDAVVSNCMIDAGVFTGSSWKCKVKVLQLQRRGGSRRFDSTRQSGSKLRATVCGWE